VVKPVLVTAPAESAAPTRILYDVQASGASIVYWVVVAGTLITVSTSPATTSTT
jgi:hypothetical protein